MRLARSRRGMVLIFALWVLGILTILAVSVAAGIREKILLVKRLDEISRMDCLLESAVKKTAGYIHGQMETSGFEFTPAVKMNLLNNSNELTNITLGHDTAGVGYVADAPAGGSLRWGVVDEESKINLNTTNSQILANLIMNVLSWNEEKSQKLADALLDWRLNGESEINGFYSEDYYSNLQHPYPKKSAAYETLDEMLLVEGMDRKIYDKLINYVTIYGSGAVNINTAPPQVLEAIGLPETAVDKILTVRRGKDGTDATGDDYVFSRTFEIAADINAVVPLTLDEARAIDAVNMRGLLTTSSFYYTVQATGKLAGHANVQTVRAVYSAQDDRIIYWNEG
ncbi:MAG: general secretion pathway protein GspK [Candidatus Omnitrophica bacterium]|nr:general secretion pathway protein GspK [Candidatus Omnitrophota bacterium]MDE2009323.1 general secretion pathway protein GspK [Candidatus Omnitrophota bacterium]MDE2214107.1 general secretion pathway protein GspK [Candidatus Omnitrophota bacterium]MDE2231144.1 general secretion pathway protein GspK [Candidatus Omnitrophota bacterium]